MADYSGHVCDFTQDPTKLVQGTRWEVTFKNLDTGEIVTQVETDLCNDPKCPAGKIHETRVLLSNKGRDVRPATPKPEVKVEIPPNPPTPPAPPANGKVDEDTHSNPEWDKDENPDPKTDPPTEDGPLLQPLPNETLWGYVSRVKDKTGENLRVFAEKYLGTKDFAFFYKIRDRRTITDASLERMAKHLHLDIEVVRDLYERGADSPQPGMLVFSDR